MPEAAPRSAAPDLPLLEREHELEVIEAALDRAGAGAGSMILIEGPAGIGKTSLLAAAADRARRREFVVRTARAGQLEREMPYGVARQLFEPLLERSAAEERDRLLAGSAGLAIPALGRTDPAAPKAAADPLAPVHGLYWLLANLADASPVALAVDDAHWADPQTLRWLDYMARRLADIPVLVLVTERSGEPDPPAELGQLHLDGDVLRPSVLSEQAVAEVIATGLDVEPSAELAATCASTTAGNPFLLAEVVRALRTDAAAPDRDAAEAVAALGAESVARYVLIRLGRFGDEAIVLARAIAVLGGSPQLRHAAALAALEEDRVRELCGRLREAEILAPGQPIEFVHPLVRTAIYQELSEDAREAAHRRAAAVLGEAGVGAREVATHLTACSPNGDQYVVDGLVQAAWDAIGAGAFDAAKAYLERALAEPPEDELPIRFALGRCMLQTDPVRAPDVLMRVAQESADAGTRVRALRYAGHGLFVTGNWHEAAACYAELLDVLPSDDREQRLLVEAGRYIVSMGGNGRDATLSRHIEAVAAGLEGNTPGECLARQALGLDRFMACDTVDEVVELANSFPPSPWELRVNLSQALCRVLAWSGRWDHGRRAMLRSLESARRFGGIIQQAYFYGLLADIDRIAGRLAEAEVDARIAMDIAAGTVSALNPGREAIVNLIATLIERGELDEARRVADGLDLSAGVRDEQVAPWPLEVRGYLRLAHGELEAGASDLIEFGEEAERWGYLNPAIPWRQQAAPAIASLGRTAEAKELIEVAEERARRFGAAHLVGTVLRARGLIEPRKRGIQTLRESVVALEEYGPPHELARSLLELGAALRRDGQRSQSREPLRRALELAHRSGAGGVERRAREELAAAGSRPRSVVRSGLEALTASELRTAKLAAEGLSNLEIAQRLFVTRKTVEKHLGNAYSKLEVGGRGELAGALKAGERSGSLPAECE